MLRAPVAIRTATPVGVMARYARALKHVVNQYDRHPSYKRVVLQASRLALVHVVRTLAGVAKSQKVSLDLLSNRLSRRRTDSVGSRDPSIVTPSGLASDIKKLYSLSASDPQVKKALEEFIRENIRLVDNLLLHHRTSLANALARSVSESWTLEQLSAEVEDITKSSKRRAELIAVDQLQKLRSSLSSILAQHMGAKQFIWWTSEDKYVRPWHASRHGKTYSYSSPPKGHLPGDEIACRCHDEPVFSSGMDD